MCKIQIAFLWLAVGLPLGAQSLDRQQIEALALSRQPRLQAAQFEVDATRSLMNQAEMPPHAVLNMGFSIPSPCSDDDSGNIEASQVRSQVESAYLSVLVNRKPRQTLSQQTLPLTQQTRKILEAAYLVRARSLKEVLNSRPDHLETARAELEAASARNLPR